MPTERARGAHLTLAEFSRKLRGEPVIEVKTRQMSVVYIVRCGDFVKIGTTANFKPRLQKIRAATPFPISVVSIQYGDVAKERELHERFAAYRHHYEWFRVEGELATYLAGLPEADG